MEFLNSDLTEAFGITMFHSFWQALIAMILVVLVRELVNEHKALLRYYLNLVILAIFLIANAVTFVALSARNSSDVQHGVTGLYILPSDNPARLILPMTGVSWLSMLNAIIPSFMIFWLLGVMVLTIRFSYNLWQTNQLKKIAVLPVTSEYQELLQILLNKLAISKPVKFLQSYNVFSPSVVGHFKPVILFPVGLVNGLSLEEVEGILLHELTHIKKNDFLVNVLQSCIEIIYFFNPFVWYISMNLKEDRENICDDMALSCGIKPETYLQSLARVFKYAHYRSNLALTLGINNNNTIKRMKRIMKTQSNNNNKLILSLVFIVAMTGALLLNTETGVQALAFDEGFYGQVTDQENDFTVAEASTLTMPIFPELTPTRVLSEPPAIPDTTDLEKKERKKREYEKAIQSLHATKEWQELQKLHETMISEGLESISPQLEEAMMQLDKTLKMNELEIDQFEDMLHELELQFDNEEFQRTFEQSQRALEEAMEKVEFQMLEIDLSELDAIAEEFSKGAEEYKVMAEEMAKEARSIAKEAEQQSRQYDNFFKELKPLIIKDGYVDKDEHIENLRFKDGEVWINGEQVNKEDAKKYYKVKNRYFDDDGNWSYRN